MLAPMVGLTHYAVREGLARVNPDIETLWPTEMLSSRRVLYQKENQVSEIFFHDHARGLSPQLLGNEEYFIRESIKKLEAWGARAIDINMGCPVHQALKHNYGVALMGDPDYAARVTEMAVKSTALPVSVKLRAGFQRDEDFLVRFAKGLENAGASWITLHPRTADQGRKGSADWSQIRVVAEALRIPVIGNGDIHNEGDIERMLQETGCARVMVGRALLAKPTLLRYKRGARCQISPYDEGAFYGTFLKETLKTLKMFYEVSAALRKMRFLLYHSSVYLEFGHTLYARIKNAVDLDEMALILDTFFSTPQKSAETTSRRR